MEFEEILSDIALDNVLSSWPDMEQELRDSLLAAIADTQQKVQLDTERRLRDCLVAAIVELRRQDVRSSNYPYWQGVVAGCFKCCTALDALSEEERLAWQDRALGLGLDMVKEQERTARNRKRRGSKQ